MSSRKCKSCSNFFSVKLDSCPQCGTPYGDKPAPFQRPQHACQYGPACMYPGRVTVDSASGPIFVCVEHVDAAMQYSRNRRWEAAGRPPAADSIARAHHLAKSPAPTPRAHWEAVLANSAAPESTRAAARDCLKRLSGSNHPVSGTWQHPTGTPPARAERVPGEDDEIRADDYEAYSAITQERFDPYSPSGLAEDALEKEFRGE